MDTPTAVVTGVIVVGFVVLVVWAAWRRKNDTRTALLRELARYRGLKRLVSVIVWFFTGLSVWLNVANAPNNLTAYVVAGMIPIAVLGNVELLTRIPNTSKWLSLGRIVAALFVGALAVRLSYMHQEHYVGSIGYEGLDRAFIPLIIDGSMVVAVLSLVEVNRKVRALEEIAYPSGVPGKSEPALAAAAAEADSTAPGAGGAGVSAAGRRGPRGDYGPRDGVEYDESHQRRRARQGKPRNTPVKKAAKPPAKKATPAKAPAKAAAAAAEARDLQAYDEFFDGLNDPAGGDPFAGTAAGDPAAAAEPVRVGSVQG